MIDFLLGITQEVVGGIIIALLSRVVVSLKDLKQSNAKQLEQLRVVISKLSFEEEKIKEHIQTSKTNFNNFKQQIESMQYVSK